MRQFIILLLAALCACSAPPPSPSAQQPAPSGIEIRDAYALPSPNGTDIAAGYLTIANHGAEDQLVSASSPRAREVALHTMEMDGAVMQMRMVESMAIPAGGELTLSPGGDHLMFTGLTAPFAAGETIPVHLRFAHAGEMDVSLPVRDAAHAGQH